MARNDRTLIRRAIYGALLDSINRHGPITADLIPSATKRILGALAVPKEATQGNKSELCEGCKKLIQIGEKRIKTRRSFYHENCIPLPEPLIRVD